MPVVSGAVEQNQFLGERVGPQGAEARRLADRCARHGGDEAPSRATTDGRGDADERFGGFVVGVCQSVGERNYQM